MQFILIKTTCSIESKKHIRLMCKNVSIHCNLSIYYLFKEVVEMSLECHNLPSETKFPSYPCLSLVRFPSEVEP